MNPSSSEGHLLGNIATTTTTTTTTEDTRYETTSTNRNSADLENGSPVSHATPAAGTSQQPPKPKGLAHLDGLRGIAAFMVYMAHWVSYWYECTTGICYGWGYQDSNRLFATLPFVRVFFTGGNPAVAIFFVLSGYVLSLSPLRMLYHEVPFASLRKTLVAAGIRRPFRLFIPPIALS
ncbi:hypothetical protein KC317_g20661, partial [Hortaea werneckii]